MRIKSKGKLKVLLFHDYQQAPLTSSPVWPPRPRLFLPNSYNENIQKRTAVRDAPSKNSKFISLSNSRELLTLVFIQVVSLGEGQASVLQGLHLHLLRLLFGLLLHPLLLQDLLDGDLLQEGVTWFVQVLQRQHPVWSPKKASESFRRTQEFMEYQTCANRADENKITYSFCKITVRRPKQVCLLC